MNNLPVTLKQFFAFPEGGLPKDIEARLEASEAMAKVQGVLAQQARGLSWGIAWSKIIGGLDELLNISLQGILVKAWKKYQELRKYRDKERYPPYETYLVHLVEHTIKSEHHPYLEILINGVEIHQKIEFTISLALTIEGAVLKIKDGKIEEIMPGSCKGEGTLACGEFILLKQETRTFALPASINLGEGIPIPD